MAAITWVNQSNVTIVGTTITKTSGGDGTPNGGAVSSVSFSGDADVTFVAPATGIFAMFGLSPNATRDIAADLLYAFRFFGGTAEWGGTESNVYRAPSDVSYAAGDTFKFTRVGTTIRYSLMYTSTVPSTGALYVQALFWDLNNAFSNADLTAGSGGVTGGTIAAGSSLFAPIVGALIGGAHIASTAALFVPAVTGGSGGGTTTITWIDTANVTVVGGTITKTSGGLGTPNAGGVSSQTFAGDGETSFVAPATGLFLIFGFSPNATRDLPADMPYAFRFFGGTAEYGISETNTYHGPSDVAYVAGDTFKLTRVGTTVRYYKNNVLMYTSGVATSATLGSG
jgi:hypothetical protein